MSDFSALPASPSVPTEGHGTPVVGQWAVISGTWRDEIGEITKVSPKQVRTRRYGDREAHHMPQEIIFSGTEKQARDLLSVLTGLNARNDRNKKQLADQHRDARAAAVQKARTASSVGTEAQPKCTKQPASKGENTKEMGHEG